MNASRPKNLNLFTIHFPIPAIVSILHRVSGVILFLLIPFVLCLFQYSLTDEGFSEIQQWLGSFYFKALFWLLFIPFCFHLVAGIRHLLMDIHIGISKKGGRISSYLVIIFSLLIIALAGFWLW